MGSFLNLPPSNPQKEPKLSSEDVLSRLGALVIVGWVSVERNQLDSPVELRVNPSLQVSVVFRSSKLLCLNPFLSQNTEAPIQVSMSWKLGESERVVPFGFYVVVGFHEFLEVGFGSGEKVIVFMGQVISREAVTLQFQKEQVVLSINISPDGIVVNQLIGLSQINT